MDRGEAFAERKERRVQHALLLGSHRRMRVWLHAWSRVAAVQRRAAACGERGSRVAVWEQAEVNMEPETKS